MALRLALQLYSVGEDAKKDLDGTLRRVKEMGYEGVEFAGLYGHDAAEVSEMLHQYGLIPVSAHVSLEELETKFDEVAASYKQIGCPYLAVPYLIHALQPVSGNFEEAISRIEADNAFLYKVLGKPYDNNRGGDLKDEETVFVLTKRLKLLDKVLVSVISGNASLNGDVRNDLLSYVSDKDKFIHDTYHQYKRLHPRFVAFLRSKGLSEWETGYCCLYALGLRGKDVGAFLERGGHYNIDSRIRRKLGLGTEDANLGNYVRSRLKELSD